jgi:hypothetical protein
LPALFDCGVLERPRGTISSRTRRWRSVETAGRRNFRLTGTSNNDDFFFRLIAGATRR